VPSFGAATPCFTDVTAVEALGVTVDCGTITVPEQHGVDDGRTLQLGVVRHHATGATPGAPVFFLAGGPGGSIMGEPAGLLAAPEAYQRLIASHDLIFLDQRGAGFSTPDLGCPEVQAATITALQANDAQDELAELIAPAIGACHERLVADAVNLEAFDSVENAADINDTVTALGYDRAILYGQSYGTELVQHVMRDFPGLVESAVLDGSAPLSNPVWERDLATAYEAGLDRVFAACTADPGCDGAYPDLAGVFEEQIGRLQEQPLSLAAKDFSGGMTEDAPDIEIELDGETAAGIVQSMIGEASLRAFLPVAIYGLQDGDASGLALATLGLTSPSPFAIGTHLATICADDPVTSADQLATSRYTGPNLFAQRQVAAWYLAGCAAFDVKPIEADVDTNVASDVPVLFLNGAYDTATPASGSAEIARTLPNSVTVEFPEGGHIQIGPGRDPCAAGIMAQFIDDPTAELDTSCVAAIPPTQFLGK